jgi:hypothetical protein
MIEKIVVAALVVLAGAYLTRRFLKKGGSACGCSGSGQSCCSGSSSSGCCSNGQQEIGRLRECGCSRKQ